MNAVFTNVTVVLFWNLIVLFTCKSHKEDFFNENKKLHSILAFENNSFYSKIKIKKWKDKLPQYTSKHGFSKKQFTLPDKKDSKYINKFILETCRAEWNHAVSLIIIFPIILFNKPFIALTFTFLVLLTNVPFILIQRYNRIRLLALRDRIKAKSPKCDIHTCHKTNQAFL